MKATLEFNLPEDTDEHYLAVNGNKYRYILSAFTEELRQLIRDKGDSTGYNMKTVQKLHERLWEIMDDEGIDINNDVR